PCGGVSVNPLCSRRPFDPSQAIWQDSPGQLTRSPDREASMKVEDTLKGMGLAVPNLEDLYRSNASGAHYISHFPVQGMLFLSGTVPIKDGKPYLPGVVGESLTLEQGYEAARYAALTTLAAVKYALGDLDRLHQIRPPPALHRHRRVTSGAADLRVAI